MDCKPDQHHGKFVAGFFLFGVSPHDSGAMACQPPHREHFPLNHNCILRCVPVDLFEPVLLCKYPADSAPSEHEGLAKVNMPPFRAAFSLHVFAFIVCALDLQFCVPEEVMIRSKAVPAPKSWSFVVTSNEYHRRYGVCLSFYELADARKDPMLYVAKTMCLMSDWYGGALACR